MSKTRVGTCLKFFSSLLGKRSFAAETLTKIYETNVEIENHKTVQLASVLTSLPFIFVTSKLNAVARIISCMNSIITSLGEY